MGPNSSKDFIISPKARRLSFKEYFTTLRFGHGFWPKARPKDMLDDNIFGPIQKDDILCQIPIGRHHPVKLEGIEDGYETTYHTNSFYANAFLGDQTLPIWTHPYSIWWGKGTNKDNQFKTWGMNVAHVEEEDVIFGEGDPPVSYTNPRRQSLIFSAKELDEDTILTTSVHLPFSVLVNLKAAGSVEPIITFPVVQGMGFITGIYVDATPIIQCPGKGFTKVSLPVAVEKMTKYRLEDNDGRLWLMYVTPTIEDEIPYDADAFFATDDNNFAGPGNFQGYIQLAKNPLGAEGEAIYDKAAGTMMLHAIVTATVYESRATYMIRHSIIGEAPLLVFALPHHMESLDPALKGKVTKLKLRTTTKGVATGILTDDLTLIEPNLPNNISFNPIPPALFGTRPRLSPQTTDFLNIVATEDLQTMVAMKTPEDTTYFAGKHLYKLATIVWVLKEILNNPRYKLGLEMLKSKFARFVENRQLYPLYYDDSWKGLVSSAGFRDFYADFGNTLYNDHHCQYAYFVYVAAVIGYLDPSWLEVGDNKAWTNSLVKDFAESDYCGRDYPFSRSFDWYHGHSWDKGLWHSENGKDAMACSEDGFASLAILMWGRVTGDRNMEKRGTLMLAIQCRTLNTYFYMHPQSDFNSNGESNDKSNDNSNVDANANANANSHAIGNSNFNVNGNINGNSRGGGKRKRKRKRNGNGKTRNDGNGNGNVEKSSQHYHHYHLHHHQPDQSPRIHPAAFTPNLLTGILLENKVDHQTHMGQSAFRVHVNNILPITPATPFLRHNKQFVAAEMAKFCNDDDDFAIFAQAEGPWISVLMANMALVNPRKSFRFFRHGFRGHWDERWIDDAGSRTWYLLWAALLGGDTGPGGNAAVGGGSKGGRKRS